MSKALTKQQIDDLIDRAYEAAEKAGREAYAKYGDRDACGFAWTNVKPGTSRLARRLKERGGRADSYYGGVTVWMPGRQPTQSVSVHEAASRAFAQVLSEAGFDAHSSSRLD